MGFGSTFHWLLIGSAVAYILAVVGVRRRGEAVFEITGGGSNV